MVRREVGAKVYTDGRGLIDPRTVPYIRIPRATRIRTVCVSYIRIGVFRGYVRASVCRQPDSAFFWQHRIPAPPREIGSGLNALKQYQCIICCVILENYGLYAVLEGGEWDTGNAWVTTLSDLTSDMTSNSGAPLARGGAELLTLDGLDKRTRPYRRYVAIRDAIHSDLGGEEVLSEVQRQMVSTFATLAMRQEVLAAEAAQGEEIDLDLYGRIADRLRRIGETIGLERVSRDVTPSLQEYIAKNYGGEAAE